MRGSRRDGGQAAVVLVVTTAVLFVAITAGVRVTGARMLDRTRAQTAADAAALASLEGGRRAAQELADRHDATLVSFVEGPDPHRVTVVVRVGEATASAAASDAP